MNPAPNWEAAAYCRRPDVDDALFFPEGENARDDAKEAKFICTKRCDVVRDCLFAAVQEERRLPLSDVWGIRGGLTERERRRLLAGAA